MTDENQTHRTKIRWMEESCSNAMDLKIPTKMKQKSIELLYDQQYYKEQILDLVHIRKMNTIEKRMLR